MALNKTEAMNAQVLWLKKISTQLDEMTGLQKSTVKVLDKLLSVGENNKESLQNIHQRQLSSEENRIFHHNVSNISDSFSQLFDTYIQDKIDNKTMDEAYRLRKANIVQWKRQLNERKIAFYNKVRAEGIIRIYSTFMTGEDIYIPKKFREKDVSGESEEHKQRKKELSLMKMNIEVERLKEQVTKYEKILLSTAQKIEQIINKNEDKAVQEKLLDIWLKEISREEEKSNAIWQKKKEWFENLPNSTGITQSLQTNQQPNFQNRKNTPRKWNRPKQHSRNSGHPIPQQRTTNMSYADVVRNVPSLEKRNNNNQQPFHRLQQHNTRNNRHNDNYSTGQQHEDRTFNRNYQTPYNVQHAYMSQNLPHHQRQHLQRRGQHVSTSHSRFLGGRVNTNHERTIPNQLIQRL